MVHGICSCVTLGIVVSNGGWNLEDDSGTLTLQSEFHPPSHFILAFKSTTIIGLLGSAFASPRYVHRLVVHAKTGYSLRADWWRTEHLAGTELWEAGVEAGWCLGTWDALVGQVWDAADDDWENPPAELKNAARTQLRMYRHGDYWC